VRVCVVRRLCALGLKSVSRAFRFRARSGRPRLSVLGLFSQKLRFLTELSSTPDRLPQPVIPLGEASHFRNFLRCGRCSTQFHLVPSRASERASRPFVPLDKSFFLPASLRSAPRPLVPPHVHSRPSRPPRGRLSLANRARAVAVRVRRDVWSTGQILTFRCFERYFGTTVDLCGPLACRGLR